MAPYIGTRDVQDINGAACDALDAKFLAEGRVKAKPKNKPPAQAVHMRRPGPKGNVLPCLPHRGDTVRCYRRHNENDPALGQPVVARKPNRFFALWVLEATSGMRRLPLEQLRFRVHALGPAVMERPLRVPGRVSSSRATHPGRQVGPASLHPALGDVAVEQVHAAM